jgi:hypothetical protein
MTTKTLHRTEPTPRVELSAFSIVPALDAAIERMAARHVVSGTEVVDLLLDLRMLATALDAVNGNG